MPVQDALSCTSQSSFTGSKDVVLSSLLSISSFLILSKESSNSGKIFKEGDRLLPEFNVHDLEVARDYTRQSPECPEDVEKVIVYR